jgi:hypothetical protein
MNVLGLADLSDASHLYDRGFFLPLCKGSSLFTIGVDTTKGFAVRLFRMLCVSDLSFVEIYHVK